MENIRILVIYIGIAGVRSEDIDTYIARISDKIIPETFDGEVIILPEQSVNTRIECINPKYITNKELMREHEEMMIKLQEELKIQLNMLKENNNG